MLFRIAFRMANRSENEGFGDMLRAVIHFPFQAHLTLRDGTRQTLTLQAGYGVTGQ